jgi:hypothetical protein
LTIQVTKLIGHKELYTDLTPLHPNVCTRRACLFPFQSLRDTPVDTKQFFTTQEITTTSFHTKSSTAEANNMTVNTVSSENVVYVNGKPTFVTGIKKADRGGRGNDGGRGGRGGGWRGGRGGRDGGGPRNSRYRCRAEQLQPRLDLVTPGKLLAFDCEGLMLPQSDNSKPKGVGRVSVVNEKLELVYDTFVHYGPNREHRPDPQVLKMGVKYQDIRPENGAQLYEDVLKALKTIFDKSGGRQDKIGGLVAHDFLSDRRMLKDLDFSSYKWHDTQDVSEYRALNDGNPPGLKMLAADVLGDDLDRADGHSSIDDARVTMQLWLYHTTGQIPQLANRRVQPGRSCKKPGSHYAPGHLVALPMIPGQQLPGKMFDKKTSTYVPAMKYVYELGIYVPIDTDESALYDNW